MTRKREFGPYVTVESAGPMPWRTAEWSGETVGIEGCKTTGLVGADVVLVVAFGMETAGRVTNAGLVCGIVLLSDGRFVGWESPFGPYAVPGGYAYVARSFVAIEPRLSDGRRAVLRYSPPPPSLRLASADVTPAERQTLYAATERLALAWMEAGDEGVADGWLKYAANVMPVRPP